MTRGLTVLFCASFLVTTGAMAGLLSPRQPKAFRTINTDQYEVAIHKNGTVDILITSQQAAATGIHPMVWFDGDPAPKPLPVDPQWSNRIAVNNRLGEGQGMWFKKDSLDWSIQTYPSKPYITARVAFENVGKKSVTIKALIPWAIGGAKKGSLTLGPASSQSMILEGGRCFGMNNEIPQIVNGRTTSLGNCAAVNPQTGFSLIAGFLTQEHAYGQIALELNDLPQDSSMRAICIFDPPVEVPPGKRLESEQFYIALTERNPLDGLERFGQAIGAFNGIGPQAHRLPHGWDSWNTLLKSEVDEKSVLAALEVFDRDLKRYGWTHFSIGGGWQQATGTWEANSSKFPHGMKWLADQVHARKMTAGIWIDPFTAVVDSAVAREHPDWLRIPSEPYRSMLTENERIIDVTIPEAYAWVRALAARIGSEWGYDTLQQGDFANRLLYADHYAASGITRMDVFRLGIQALREGLGENSFVTTFAPVQATEPVWRNGIKPGAWGCVEVMTNAARRYYFAPYCWIADTDCSYFGLQTTRNRWSVGDKPALTDEQVHAWLTAAVMTGGTVRVGDWPPDLSTEQRSLLTRLLPVIGRPARPVDLFGAETPAIWSLPIQCAIGSWGIAAVFNWSDTPAKMPVALARLGLDAEAYYTVYDFWRDKFYGLAKGQVTLDMPAGSVRLLGLRRYEGHPMFLATDRHFTQGATDFTALEWNGQTQMLSGTFTGVEDTDYNLRVLVPEAFAPKSTLCSAEVPKTEQVGKVFKIAFHCKDAAPVTWSVQF